MASVNRIILLGRLGKDPELRSLPSGSSVCSFSLATSDNFMSNGEKKERTEWHNIIVFGKQADTCAQYLSKGRECYIEGRVQYRQYEKDGNTRYITEIVADRVQFIGGKSGGVSEKDVSSVFSEKEIEDDVSF